MKYYLKYIILLFLCLTSAECLAKGGGGTQPVCTATPPSQASAVGYNNLTFCTDFTTNQSIDAANTLNPGYSWYIQHYGAQPRNTIPPKFLLNDGTGLWLAGDSNSKASVLFTAAQIGTSQNWVGQGFSNGFYAECSRKLDPTAITSGEPSMWFQTIPFLMGNTAVETYEIDVGDWNSSFKGAPLFNVYDWLAPNNSTWYGNTNNIPTVTGVIYTNYNKYGLLWVPSTQNGGTGYFKFYINDTLYTTVTYSPGGTPSPSTCSVNYGGSQPCPSGTYSGVDTQTLFLMVGTDIGGTGGASQANHTIKNCHVFQL